MCLSLCNYFEADDRDWLFACDLVSVHGVSQDTSTHTPFGMNELNGSSQCINPLDSPNKGLGNVLNWGIEKSGQCIRNYCAVFLRL